MPNGKHLPVPKEIEPNASVKWKCVQGRASIDVSTSKITVSIDKKTGIVSFASNKLGILLAERTKLSRQYNEADRSWFHYLAWKKNENIKAMDTDESWTDIISTA